MLPSEHTALNRCFEKMASLPIVHHGFVRRLKERVVARPYMKLSAGEKQYLHKLHMILVSQGLVESEVA
jgi:hypothetical protein